MLLGMSADEVAPLKEAPDPKPYEGLLERVAWSEWLLRVQSRTQCAPLLAAGLSRTAPRTLRGAGSAMASRGNTWSMPASSCSVAGVCGEMAHCVDPM